MIVHVNEFSLLVNYIVAIIVSIIVAIGLRLPLVPEKPRRFSWTNSAIFPTPVIAIGLLAIVYSLGFYWIYDGMVIAVIIAVFAGIFVRYLFNYVLPKPPSEDDLNE
jgi:energy-converting hydrogenase A subunit A